MYSAAVRGAGSSTGADRAGCIARSPARGGRLGRVPGCVSRGCPAVEVIVVLGARRLGPTEPRRVLDDATVEAQVAERAVVQRPHLPHGPTDAVLVRDQAGEPSEQGRPGRDARGVNFRRWVLDQ